MVLHFVWKKKWPAMQLLTDPGAVDNGLTGWSVTWRAYYWKICKKDMGKKYVDESLQMGKVHVSRYQKVISRGGVP